VKKVPKSGDFRVQEELGGSVHVETPPQQIMTEAERIVDIVDGDLLYARGDVVDRPAGVTLMELELIEPWLFLISERGAERTIRARYQRADLVVCIG